MAKKGLRKRKKPDIKGIVEKEKNTSNNIYQDDENDFSFNPKKIKIRPNLGHSKKDDESLEQNFLGDDFLEKWKKSVDDEM